MSDPNEPNSEPASTAWYKDGLHFTCTECGKCCTGASGYVWVSEDEVAAMAAVLNITIDLFKKKYIRRLQNRMALTEKKNQGDYDCIFLKDKKCLIYQARPVQCRTYPWWKENLTSEKSWELAAQNCEGINKNADLVPYSQIVQLLRTNEENRKKQGIN